MLPVPFTRLTGQTFTDVLRTDDAILFKRDGQTIFTLMHDQDCCEYVTIDDITGDLKDLENTPILEAKETNQEGKVQNSLDSNSCTWSFYDIRTIKGSVTIRFYGESNGYYSETADLYEIKT